MVRFLNWKVVEAVSRVINRCTSEIKKVVEYANCYYVQFTKGKGKFISKASVTDAREDLEIKNWLRDFGYLRNTAKLVVGSVSQGIVKEFDGWTIDAMEAAIYHWRVGIAPAHEKDRVWLGYVDYDDNLIQVCDYQPELIF